MASNCIDLNDQIYQSKKRVGTSPIIKGNGELNLYAVDQFKTDFLEGIKDDGLFDPLDLAIKQYGDEVSRSLSTMNRYLETAFQDGNGVNTENAEENYAELLERLRAGPISAIEYADFMGAYHYNPPKISSESILGNKNLLKNLNSYYRNPNQSLLGGFCSMMPNVFGAIGGFFSIIGSVAGLINDALSFLTKLRNLEDPIKAIIERLTVTALINSIKEKLTSVITETWDKVKAAVQNFDLAATVGQVATYIKTEVWDKAVKIKDEIMAIMTDENREGLVNKAKGLFDYAVGLFANPNLEKIQFLIARFCGLVNNVEALIKDIKTPLDNYAFKYQRVVGRMKRIANMTTARAVSSGAVRYDDETRRTEINRMRKQWSPPAQPPRTTDNVDPQGEVTAREMNDRTRLPNTHTACGGLETGPNGTGTTGGQHHTPSGEAPNNPHPPTPEELSGIPTWDEIKDGNHPKIAFTSDMGEYGWTGLEPDTKARLMRLQEMTGAKLIINSGKRTEQYQAQLRERYRRQGQSRGRYVEGRGWNYGVAFQSQHLLGKALDIRYGNWDRTKFIDDAKRCGFNWIKRYNSFIHIDTRAV